MQKYLNTTHRTVIWFKKAFEDGELEIKAPFQRNPVWSERQQAALIDTILLEYPIPELYMQEITYSTGGQKQVLVDGQQRIRAVLDFLAGKFELKDESPKWPGLSFKDLSDADKKKIFEYSFVVRLLPDMPDEEVRAIFQRLNRNTMTLTSQELRHATYWGPFIKLMEEISDFEFWNDSGIFSANDRRRMNDVEFISELAVAHLNGIQNKKKNLEEYYQQYEVSFDDAEPLRSTFVSVLGEISQLLPDLPKTRWRKKSDFYTLFVYLATNKDHLPLAGDTRKQVGAFLHVFSVCVDGVIRDEDISEYANVELKQSVNEYVENVERAASDLATRMARHKILSQHLGPILLNK